jgi:hypothetical protein
MTDARVDDPARGDWARCAPLVATQPVFPGQGGMVSQHAYRNQANEKRLRRRPTVFPTGREFRAAAAGSAVPGRLFRLVMRLRKLLQHS